MVERKSSYELTNTKATTVLPCPASKLRPFKGQWSRDASTGLTFWHRNLAFKF
jgi:hypothetical protein